MVNLLIKWTGSGFYVTKWAGPERLTNGLLVARFELVKKYIYNNYCYI